MRIRRGSFPSTVFAGALFVASCFLLLPGRALAQGCTYTLSPQTHTATAGSATVAITVTTQPGCTWTPIPTVGWVNFEGQTASTGSGQFTLRIQANLSTQAQDQTQTPAVLQVQNECHKPQSRNVQAYCGDSAQQQCDNAGTLGNLVTRDGKRKPPLCA